MSSERARETRDLMAKYYLAGIVVFVGFFGFVTVFALFLSRLK